ncbi:NAD(P)/FAD-dependent oxidoreductase [Sphingobacterium multivorum]|nr:NAD(P)/FAD-dependent oxidoreductase [Sphingobacterium multivorum]
MNNDQEIPANNYTKHLASENNGGITKKSAEVVVIGGGFAGVNLVRSLAKSADFSITLVDRNNYVFFPPLIYQVATGFLEPPSISFPFRKLLRKYKNVRFWLGDFIAVRPEEKKVVLSTGELHYDYLVFATGTESNYFGMENIRKNAIPMKTMEDALHMRNTILQRVERASRTKNESERRKLLTIVIAGGGPTGVEIAGMLAEMKHNIFPKEYPELSHFLQTDNLYLVDGAASVLSPMSEKSRQYTYKSLTDIGVTVKLNIQVADFDGESVLFTDGTRIETHNLIWSAGITGTVFSGIPETSYGRGKRILVDKYNLIKDFSNIYAIGDISLNLEDSKFPNGHPQLAQVALQQGKNLALNLKAGKVGKPSIPFAYKDKGSMAIIGRNKAVADISSKVHFKGYIAWLLWVFVHLISLVNYRNKVRTLYNWCIAYFTKDHSLRLIIRPAKPKCIDDVSAS